MMNWHRRALRNNIAFQRISFDMFFSFTNLSERKYQIHVLTNSKCLQLDNKDISFVLRVEILESHTKISKFRLKLTVSSISFIACSKKKYYQLNLQKKIFVNVWTRRQTLRLSLKIRKLKMKELSINYLIWWMFCWTRHGQTTLINISNLRSEVKLKDDAII